MKEVRNEGDGLKGETNHNHAQHKDSALSRGVECLRGQQSRLGGERLLREYLGMDHRARETGSLQARE